jgi:hypothetical protein
MAPRKVPIQIAPGVLKSQSDYASPGRYIDMDKVRFDEGLPEKIGGWEATGWSTVTGVPRSALAWRDNSSNFRLATGSALKVETLDNDGDELTDITPVRASGTLGTDPFTMTSGSAVISVASTGHTLEQGDYVIFENATAAGGITIDGEYTVLDVTDPDNFTITHSAAATSSTSGGGSSVDYTYLISNGEVDTTAGGGWGVGPYGSGTYGTERTGGSYLQLAARWSFDTYGEDLLAMRNNQSVLYQLDVSAGGRLTAVANAPSGTFVFVTPERVVIVLNAAGVPMAIQGSDDEDNTDWTPTITNKAFGRRLQVGSRLVAGSVLAQGINLIWSDTATYVMQFANNNTTVYATRLASKGDDFGLIGSGAFIAVGGVAYWMSSTDFNVYAGACRRMPNVDDIRDFVFDDIDLTQAEKIQCRYDPIHDEVWWHYPAADSMENNRYVAYSVAEGWWIVGSMDRSCFAVQIDQESNIIGFDIDGDSFFHERGVDANGEALPWYLESGYSDIDTGNERMDVFACIPDFKRHSEDITLTLTSKDYPTDLADEEVYEETLTENIGILDVRMSGRQIKKRLAGSAIGSDFRLGRLRLEVNDAGGRR